MKKRDLEDKATQVVNPSQSVEVFDCPGCDGKGTILSSQTKRGGFYSMCKVCDGTGKKP